QMDAEQIEQVVHLWRQQYEELGSLDFVNYVQIFENKGQMMGCSNPHPHGQVWATSTIPFEPERESSHQLEYYAAKGHTLLQDYVAAELEKQERIVCKNDLWVALVPYWAKWP